MVGNAGETWNSIEQTITLAKDLKSDNPTCSIVTPFPGTSIMEEAEKNGWLRTKDWDKYLTTPHLDPVYTPVATTGRLSAEERVQAYYKVNVAFAKVKLITRYGRMYLFNPKFYLREVGDRVKNQGIWNTLRLGLKLVKGKCW